jgi:hypothetical protein
VKASLRGIPIERLTDLLARLPARAFGIRRKGAIRTVLHRDELVVSDGELVEGRSSGIHLQRLQAGR